MRNELITIENKNFSVSIHPLGAELRQITRKADNHQYMWRGDSTIWSGVAPILFPVVGRLKDDFYQYKGKDYSMAKHGFARRSLFTAQVRQNAATFILEHTETTLSIYPFPFRLTVHFLLAEQGLTVTHTVETLGDTPCWFSIGAHPAFACSMGDTLHFDKPETVHARRLHNDLLGDAEPFLNHAQDWVIHAGRFHHDAYILENLSSQSITLQRKNDEHNICFSFKAPYLGIWAKPGADYVCLEPWYGLDDSPVHNHQLTEKLGIQKIQPEEPFHLTYHIGF